MSGSETPAEILGLLTPDHFAYAKFLRGEVVDMEISLRYNKKFQRLDNLSANVVLFGDATFSINGNVISPFKWGRRTAKSGRTYSWFAYKYGAYTIFVHVFEREKKPESGKA